MDRNLAGRHLVDLGQKSLSARRAWIEMIRWPALAGYRIGRSPQGERG